MRSSPRPSGPSGSPRATRTPRSRVVCWVAVLAVALSLGSGTSSAAPKTTDPPQLSIAVDDGKPDAKAGDKLSYVVTLTNVGTKDVKDLVVTQSVPAGVTLSSADADGKRRGAAVEWTVDLEATKKATFKTTMKLVDTPDELLRLATVACAKVSAKSAPVVCASDSNLLPAGAAAQTPQQTPTPMTERSWWLIGAAVAAALLVAGLVLLIARRRGAKAGALAAPVP